jgi:hypothetical protein
MAACTGPPGAAVTIGVLGGVVDDPDADAAPEDEVDPVAVEAGPVAVEEGEGDGAGEALGVGVGVGAVMVVVVPAALACRVSKVDQEPTICQIAKDSQIAVQIAQVQTAGASTFPGLPFPGPPPALSFRTAFCCAIAPPLR